MTSHSVQSRLRIGLDLGGSKIEGILLSPEATEMARYRIATPRDDYAATIVAIVDLTCRLTQDITAEATIGIAVPGSIDAKCQFDLAQRAPLRPRPSNRA